MLLRVAAWCVAAFLIAVPASAGIETGVVANPPATAIADAPMGVAAAPIDMPQENIAAEAEDATGIKTEPQPVADAPAQADIPPSVQPIVQAAVSPTVQKQDQTEARAPAKLAALDAPAPDRPNAVVPRAEMPSGDLLHDDSPHDDLPRIDASFRFTILPVNSGGVLAKWNGVKADIRAERKIFERCRENMDLCPAAAKQFLDIVDQGRALTGRARVGVINRAVNMSIEPVSDMAQWGVPDRWSAPLETFTTHKGDCEDYAIAKYVALTESGIATEDVKLIIVHNTAAKEDHAVTAVRLDGSWMILDNRWLKLVEDKALQQAVPMFALGNDGVRQYLPDTSVAARRAPAPAALD
jgi:predicted transglutaminase-like cysteine proteinase